MVLHFLAGDEMKIMEGVAGEPGVDGGGDVDDAALDPRLPRRFRHLIQQQLGEQEMAWNNQNSKKNKKIKWINRMSIN